MEDRYLDSNELAELLQMSFYTVSRWRTEGKGPAFIRLGNKVRYRKSDVDAFLAAHTVPGGAA